MLAYAALQKLLKDPNDKLAEQQLNLYSANLGYGLLLKRHLDDITQATPAQIQAAAWDTT